MSANASQVGGTHYKGLEYQHWDFAIDARLPYMEGQITKYVDRYIRKKGREDLEKALHFAQKLLESAVEGRVYPIAAGYAEVPLKRYHAARPLQPVEDYAIIMAVVNWTRSAHLETVVAALSQRIMTVYENLLEPRP